MKTLSNAEAELKKGVAYKKSVYLFKYFTENIFNEYISEDFLSLCKLKSSSITVIMPYTDNFM